MPQRHKEYQAYCQFCDVQVKCDNAGKTQLLQHSKQKMHIDAIKHSVDKKQKKLVVFQNSQEKVLPVHHNLFD